MAWPLVHIRHHMHVNTNDYIRVNVLTVFYMARKQVNPFALSTSIMIDVLNSNHSHAWWKLLITG